MSNSDVVKVFAAGATDVPVQKGGDFIFIKFANQPLRITVDGQTVEMRAGDKRRFPKKFEGFEVSNPNTTSVAAVFVVGHGDYNSQIITGEITALPGVRREDGTFEPDTRYKLPLVLALDPGFEPTTYTRKAHTAYGSLGLSGALAASADGKRLVTNPKFINGSEVWWDEYTLEGEFVRTIPINFYKGGSYLGSPAPSYMCYYQDNRWIGANNGPLVKVADAAGSWDILNRAGNRVRGLSFADGVLWVLWQEGTGGSGQPQSLRGYQSNVTGNFNEVYRADGIREAVGFDANGLHVEGRTAWLGNQGNLASYALDSKSLIRHETGWFPGGNASQLLKVGHYWVCVTSGGFTKAVAETFTVSARGISRLVPGGGTAPRFFKQSFKQAFTTEAALNYASAPSGMLVEGEIIKAALEMYFGRHLAPNYLDHVFGVSCHSDGPPELLPPLLETVTSGESFAAAGLSDHFTIHRPGWVEITVDASLPFAE